MTNEYELIGTFCKIRKNEADNQNEPFCVFTHALLVQVHYVYRYPIRDFSKNPQYHNIVYKYQMTESGASQTIS